MNTCLLQINELRIDYWVQIITNSEHSDREVLHETSFVSEVCIVLNFY
jgi:hypothetical protein